jgi:hypothetical protein
MNLVGTDSQVSEARTTEWSVSEGSAGRIDVIPMARDAPTQDTVGSLRPSFAYLSQLRIVSLITPNMTREAGIANYDPVHWSGIFTMATQLAVASIPYSLSGD